MAESGKAENKYHNDRPHRRHHPNYDNFQRRRDVMYDNSDMYYGEMKEDEYPDNSANRRSHYPYYNHQEEEKMDRPTHPPRPPIYHHTQQPPYHQQQSQEDVSMELEPIADWRNPGIDFRDQR